MTPVGHLMQGQDHSKFLVIIIAKAHKAGNLIFTD